MFTVVFIALALVLVNYLIASPWVRLFVAEVKNLQLVLSQLIGFSALLLVSFIIISLNLPTYLISVLVLVMVLIGIINILWTRKRFPRSLYSSHQNSYWPAFFSIIPALFFARLMMNGLVNAGFTTRYGPDLLGWAGASLALCRGETLSSLSQSVQTQLGQTPIAIAFIPPSTIDSQNLYISQIASFSDQIAAEFLIGAHRTGIPGLLGGICSLTSESAFSFLIGAIEVWAIFMLGVIAYFVVRSCTPTKKWAIASSIVLPMSFGILSVGLEGGVGQLISLPYLLASCWFLSSSKSKLSIKVIVISAAFLFASTSYIDLIFILAPLICLSSIANWKGLLLEIKNTQIKQLFGYAVLLTLSLSPAMLNIISFTSGFLSYSGSSGWNQGRSPLPSNMLGLTPWLPSDGFSVSARTLTQWIVDGFVTCILLIAILFSGIKRNLWLVCCFLLYCYLFLQIYLVSEIPNNYRLWKLASYMCALLPILISGLISEKQRSNSKMKQTKRILALFVLFSTFSSSLVWMTGWMDNRRSQISQESANFFKEIASKYDVVVDLPVIPAELALYGDLHYGLKSRGGGLETNFSSPERSVVIVRPLGQHCDKKCEQLLPNGWTNITFQNVDSNQWFEIQKVSHD